MLNDKIKKLEEKYRETYLEYWRDIHRHPELSYKENRTASKVADILNSLGMEVKTEIGGTGVTGLLKGKKEGPVVALRADMDALQIKEETGCEFGSENEGVMHACGHDSHTAMLLGTAHILSEMKDQIMGTIKFIFQPAEEYSPTGGAPGMIKDGALENPDVSAILGVHVWPTLQTGQLGIREGVMSAASDRLQISIKGKSTHAATPEFGIDAVVIASEVVSSLQTLVSRNVSPLDSAVITIGKINGGTRYNIVADEVELDGTVRTFDPATRKMLSEKIASIVEGTVQGMGGTCKVNYRRGYPSVMNDPEITSTVSRSIDKVVGKEGLFKIDKPNLGGEDFAFFAEKVPSAFVWVGCRPENIPAEDFPKLHNNSFLPDENALPIGVRYLCQAALDTLEEVK